MSIYTHEKRMPLSIAGEDDLTMGMDLLNKEKAGQFRPDGSS